MTIDRATDARPYRGRCTGCNCHVVAFGCEVLLYKGFWKTYPYVICPARCGRPVWLTRVEVAK